MATATVTNTAEAVYAEEIGSALVVMQDARFAMRCWENGDQTEPQRRRLTQWAGSLFVAVDVLQMNGKHYLAQIASDMIQEIGRLAHS
jgi:hypothetical protein